MLCKYYKIKPEKHYKKKKPQTKQTNKKRKQRLKQVFNFNVHVSHVFHLGMLTLTPWMSPFIRNVCCGNVWCNT